MSYLVVGGTGLLGSRVVRDLLQLGEEVTVYDLHPDREILEMVLKTDNKSKLSIVEGDVVDFDSLLGTASKYKTDVIIHLAAVLGEGMRANPRIGVKINVDGTINVFEVARTLGCRKVVWASSSSIFAGADYNNKLVPNDALHSPLGIYAASKSFGEYVSDYYFQECKVDITGLRFGTLYGAGQSRGSAGKLYHELMLNPALGKPGRVPGGDGSVALTLADDAARAVLLACKYKRIAIKAFNIMGHWKPVKELVAHVKEILPDADIETLPGYYPGPRVQMDPTITEKELGYHPLRSIKEGIKETINLIRGYHGLSQV